MKNLLSNRLFAGLLLALLVATGCATPKIALLVPVQDATLVQTPKEMREFLMLESEPRKEYFNDKAKRAVLYQQHQSLPNTFVWQATEPLADVRVEFALDPDFQTNAQELLTSLQFAGKTGVAKVCNFMVGKTIYWRVKGVAPNGRTVTSATRSFQTEDLLPRQITLPGVDNVRDVGGWKTLDGRRMKQGIIFRSAGLNWDSPDWNWDPAKRIDPKLSRIGETAILPEGIQYFVEKVGVKTELDLRWDGEVATMSESPMGPKVKWIHSSSLDYGRLSEDEGKEASARNFKLCADLNNYPIDFHCIAGADRTGTLAYILCGLVGVSEDDLRKDWEVTARDYFTYARYDQISHIFDQYGAPEDPLSVKIQNYLLQIGVTQEEINAFKTLILE